MSDFDENSRIVINRLEGTLIATVQSDLTASALNNFKTDLLSMIDARNVSYLIIDFVGLVMMDVSEFEEIKGIINMASLMGTETICAGFSPGIVAMLVHFEVNVEGLKTSLNLDDAFERIQHSKQS